MTSNGEGILLSPLFPAEPHSKVLLFSYRSGQGGQLQLRGRSSGCTFNCWTKLWEVKGAQDETQADIWHEAKVVIPAYVVGLQFMAVGDAATTSAAVDHLLVVEFVDSNHFAELSLAGARSCILHKSTGEVRCWGEGGLLGQGFFSEFSSDEDIGDSPLEMRNLPSIDFGSGRTVRQVSAGNTHTAVLLDDGTVKTFGYDHGTAQNRLPLVDLGHNRKALEVAAGNMGVTCILLDDYIVKCGRNGIIDVPLDLGTGRTARQISLGHHSHLCVLLDDGTVKSWPPLCKETWSGEACFQDMPSGDTVPTVDLGIGTVREIHCGTHSFPSCALTDDGRAMCWAAEADSAATQLGVGSRTVRQTTTGCVLLDDFSVKCYGEGAVGTLGQGNTADVSDLGDSLPPIDLGTGRTARRIASSEEHVCAVLDDDSIKCWGFGTRGRLGQGNTLTIGDDPNEMGDSLPPIDLQSPITEASVQVRLHGDGRSSALRGQVQVLYEGVWGAVCDDGWDDVDARVLCRQLGLAGGKSISRFGESGRMWMHRVACFGHETNLGHCPFRGWDVHECDKSEAAGVECEFDAWSDFSTSVSPASRTRTDLGSGVSV